MPRELKAHIHAARICENEQVARGLWRLVFEAPGLARDLEAGQFFTIAVASEPRQVVRIPLSFSTVDTASDTVETIYAVTGPGTEALSHLEEGAATSVIGPCGHGWKVSPEIMRCLLVAGGIGITPLLSAASSLSRENIAFDAIIGARTADMLWGEEALSALACETVLLATDDGTTNFQGTAADAFRALLKTETYDCILTCGPPAMLQAVAEIAAGANIACQVSLERNMTCGFGACSTCAVKTKTGNKSACMDGPVFNAEEVVW